MIIKSGEVVVTEQQVIVTKFEFSDTSMNKAQHEALYWAIARLVRALQELEERN